MSEVVCSAAEAIALHSHYRSSVHVHKVYKYRWMSYSKQPPAHTRHMSNLEVEIIFQHSALSCRITMIVIMITVITIIII